MLKGLRFAGVAALTLLLTAAAFADLSKGIKGKVTGRDGKPVSGALITIKDKGAQNLKWETKTDERGSYLYGGLSTNQDGYLVTVKVEGLPEVTRDCKVKVFEQVEVSFDLRKDLEMKEDKKETKVSAAAQAKDLYGMDSFEEALEKANEAILQNDNVKASSFLKAACLLKLGRLDEALSAFEAYNAKYPGDMNVLGQLAELYEKKGDKAKADEYKKQFKSKGGQVIGDTYNQGVKAFNEQKYDQAVDLFLTAIKEDSKDADAHRELAKCYSSQGKFSKAVEELKTYLKMKPNAEDKAMWEQAIPNLQKLKDTK
jgi:tetratricopeptide (TPR) repeat protein